MDETENVALDLSLPRKHVNENDSQPSNRTQESPKQTGYLSEINCDVTEKTSDQRINTVYKSFETTQDDEISVDEECATVQPVQKRLRYSERSESGSPLLPDDLAYENESASVVGHNYACDRRPIRLTVEGVTMSLHDETLWHAFSECGTEMIISRGGRRMFPHIVLSFEGLAPSNIYSVTLEIVPADDRRYKYINNQWMAMGMADPGPSVQPVAHPYSPNTGAHWTQNRTSFSKVRLTNNKEASMDCSDGNILLLSMHKYVAVIKVKDESVPSKKPLVFRFDKSTFIAVTAYQNYKITHLKIKNNPFAKAFRDAHSKANRPHSPRRKDTAVKYTSSTSKEGGSVKSLLTCPPTNRVGYPHFYPFNSTTVPPCGYDFHGLNPYIPMNVSPNVPSGSQLAYDPWLTVREHMHAMWIKNTQRLFPPFPVSLTRNVVGPVDCHSSADEDALESAIPNTGSCDSKT